MWTYSQASGILRHDGSFEGTGYSGNGDCLNDPDKQDVIGHGPCPQGAYIIGFWHDAPHLGPCVAELAPSPENEMFGRSGFFLHGDNAQGDHSASDGCIILGPALRHAMRDSQDTKLTVTG